MFGLSSEAMQHLDIIAKASEVHKQQIVSENYSNTGKGVKTAQEFVQGQLAEGRESLIAQEGTNQRAYYAIEGKQCRVPIGKGKGLFQTFDNCIKIDEVFVQAIINPDTKTVDFWVTTKNGERFTDAEYVNGKKNPQSNIDLVNILIRKIANTNGQITQA